MEPLDINDVVRRTVRLIANQKKFEHIVDRRSLAGRPAGSLRRHESVAAGSLESCPQRLHGHAQRRALTISTTAATAA